MEVSEGDPELKQEVKQDANQDEAELEDVQNHVVVDDGVALQHNSPFLMFTPEKCHFTLKFSNQAHTYTL
ncbi:Eukaryotic translation initiation factor 4E type 3 [Clarias magur]|uniref:Eukaryotic translation initiation factor 4E type 3 n=1 Tax=Clarias magur TaxID=1594786 RepID=A0A8J4U2S6_CLAMG|nr:Eukaryotic translation initiation factor 4E type 3 [Clarias magur]